MAAKKGKVLKMPLKTQEGPCKPVGSNVLGLARPRLRSNEWLRLLSIQISKDGNFP